MSHFPKLKIDVRDLTPAPKKIKLVFTKDDHIPSDTNEINNINNINKRSLRLAYKIVAVILVVTLFIVINRREKRGIRRIVRMNCHHTESYTTCTAYGNGAYSIRNCPSYEYNGVPFTEFEHDNKLIVPSAPDMTLRIVPACPSIVATLDTSGTPSILNLPMEGQMYHNTIVWLSKTCYKEFSLTIDQMVVFEHTPVQDLKHIQHVRGNISAYRIVANGHDYQLKGYGCNQPIQIYTK